MKKVFLKIALIGILLMPASVLFAQNLSVANKEQEKAALETQLGVMTEILSLYHNEALERPADLSECLREMMAMRRLGKCSDKFSHYIPSEEVKMFDDDIQGHVEGVGIEITYKNDVVVIVAPFENSPAEKSGIKAGDVILEVDNRKISSTLEAVNLIRGLAGSTVKIKIFREGVDQPLVFTVVRQKLVVHAIKSRIAVSRGQKIGIININTFTKNAPSEFKDTVTGLQKRGVKKFIFDVRNNPGGEFKAVLEILAKFMGENDVALTHKTRYNSDQYGRAALWLMEIREFGIFRGIPAIVLINKGSASAAEIFAGTMKDWGYLVLGGEASFGKGVGQTLFPLSDGSIFALTTFEFLVGNNHMPIRDKGVEPSIVVENPPDGLDNQLNKAIEILANQ